EKLVNLYDLKSNVHFAGARSRELLPNVYREHDILLFPSELDEALAITPLEAMGCGLPVVTTATGGNVEVFRHEFNALIFEKGDAGGASDHILRLLDDGELFERLKLNGHRTVAENFALDTMVERIERSLESAMTNQNGRHDSGCR